jgi:predicted transcriptional regulator of viral defense system
MKLYLLEPLERLPYFTFEGFKQVIGADETETQRARELVSRWSKRGHLIRLKKGIYMTRRFYELHRNEPSFSPAVSAILQPQSYISLEFVLQRAGILTDVTYPVTAITPKNTLQVKNPVGTFVYRHIRRNLYTGFVQHEFYGVLFSQATVAKALFDYVYLRPIPSSLRTHKYDLAEDLRLNIDLLSSKDWNEFEDYVELSTSPKMSFISENFRRTVWQA